MRTISEYRAAYSAAVDNMEALATRMKDGAVTPELDAEYAQASAEAENLEQRISDMEADVRAKAQHKGEPLPTQRRGIPSADGGFRHIGVTEPDRYEEHGRNFFTDLYLAQIKNDPAAQQRIGEHHVYEVETRDVVTGGLGGIVPPQYLVSQYARAPRGGRVFADRLNREDLMPEGMSIVVPRITGPSAAGSQASENDLLTTQDPVETDFTAPVRTVGGFIPVSRQSLERASYATSILFEDLVARYSAVVDTQLISGDGTSGTLLGALNLSSGNDTPGPISTTIIDTDAKNQWQAIADVLQQMNTAVGGLGYQADAIILNPRRWGSFLASVDDEHRPLFATGPGPMNVAGEGQAAAYGYVGSLLGVPCWTDSNVTTTEGVGSDEDAIVIISSEANLLFEDNDGMPRTLAFEQTAGEYLNVKLIAYGYVSVAWRYPQAVGFITGSGLVAPVFDYAKAT